MRYFHCIILALLLIVGACSPKKTTQSTAAEPDSSATAVASQPLTPQDSIDRAIAAFDKRLDIKMRRKMYDPKPGVLVTLQQWWEFGDSLRVVKLREEILTGTTRMQILQYHFVNGQLAEIHTNDDNRLCNGQAQQCITETKYFVRDKAWLSAVRRQATEGADKTPPNIEATPFAEFKPAKQEIADFMKRMATINAKWQTLPYPKRRPESGTPVPPMQQR